MNPAALNYLLMCIYIINAANWAAHRNWPQALYWIAAFQITAAVTWGLK